MACFVSVSFRAVSAHGSLTPALTIKTSCSNYYALVTAMLTKHFYLVVNYRE